MGFRYDEIGQRLKAYRLGSGLSADELAKKIGISRTALYRFEQGELAKIDTLERLAELLNVSIPTLLGVGIEYIPSAVSYFERMRQIEETAEQIVILSGPISFLLGVRRFSGDAGGGADRKRRQDAGRPGSGQDRHPHDHGRSCGSARSSIASASPLSST